MVCSEADIVQTYTQIISVAWSDLIDTRIAIVENIVSLARNAQSSLNPMKQSRVGWVGRCYTM